MLAYKRPTTVPARTASTPAMAMYTKGTIQMNLQFLHCTMTAYPLATRWIASYTMMVQKKVKRQISLW